MSIYHKKQLDKSLELGILYLNKFYYDLNYLYTNLNYLFYATEKFYCFGKTAFC